MKRIQFYGLVGAGLLLTFATTARAQHADISPSVELGQVKTNAFDDATSQLTPDVRVFGYDFQEDPLDPYFIQDPGFNALAGSLPPTNPNVPNSGQLFFDLLSDLQYWSGAGSASFGAVPGGESLLLRIGSQNRTVGTGTGFQTGFSLGIVANDGSLHRHLESTLNPGGGPTPADGIYLIGLKLRSVNTDPSLMIEDSLPFWVVYNNGLSEEVHDEAIDHVQATLVPEPSSFILAGFAGTACFVLWRRRNVRMA